MRKFFKIVLVCLVCIALISGTAYFVQWLW